MNVQAIAGPCGRLRVLHIIPWLAQGGAEAMLCGLVSATGDEIDHRICTLLPPDRFFDLDPALVLAGNGRRGRLDTSLMKHVRRAISAHRPEVVHGWMYHANLASMLSLGSGAAIVWSIHNTALRAGEASRLVRLVNRTSALLSSVVPNRVVYVSNAARRLHEGQGYAKAKGSVILNGVNLQKFDPKTVEPDPRITAVPGTTVVGMVARYEPGKGHHFLIDVVSQHPRRAEIRLVLVGAGCDSDPRLADHIRAAGLEGSSILLGPEPAIERLYATFDVLVLPSFSEALPLVVLEAAAMDKVVAASRVGDVPMLGLPSEMLFDPGDGRGCARAIEAAIVASRGNPPSFRATIAQHFSFERTVQSYLELYQSVARRNRRAISGSGR